MAVRKHDLGAVVGGIGDVTASVDGTAGEPSVTVSVTGTPASRDIDFAFSGIAGVPPDPIPDDDIRDLFEGGEDA